MICFSSDLPSVRLSAMPSRSNDTPLTLCCDVDRFYPEDVSVSWLQNGTILPQPPATQQNPDGTFSTRHYYTLSPKQREQGGKVECVISQPGVLHPISGLISLEKLDLKGKISIVLRMNHKTRSSTLLSVKRRKRNFFHYSSQDHTHRKHNHFLFVFQSFFILNDVLRDKPLRLDFGVEQKKNIPGCVITCNALLCYTWRQ